MSAKPFTFTLPQAGRVLLSRKRLIATVVVACVAAAAAINVFAPKRYVSTVAVVVDPRATDPVRESPAAPQPLASYLATQAEIIASRNVAMKVAEQLDGRYQSPSAGGTPAYAEHLLTSLDVKTSSNSNVIHIAYRSSDPRAAADIANAFADAYIQTSLELQVDPARRHAAWFEEQLSQLRKDLTDAQARLSAFQQEHNVLDVDEQRLDVENSRLAEISTHLVNAQAAMAEADARATQLNRVSAGQSVDQVSGVVNQPLLQNLTSELARAEAKFAEVSERFDRNHPQYRSVAAEVDALRTRLNTEIATSKSSLKQAASIARAQVQQTQASLDEQRARILALSRQRDELAVLNRDVQSARAAYDAALQQTNQSRLQSRIDRTNIAVLNPASVPMQPSSPKPMLNLALGVLLGFAFGVGIALYLEAMNPLVRSPDTLDQLGIPVLAHVPVAPDLSRRSGNGKSTRALQPRTA